VHAIVGTLFALIFIARVNPSVAPVIRHHCWLLVAGLVALALGSIVSMSFTSAVVYVLIVLIAFAAYGWFRLLSDEERTFVMGFLSTAPSQEAA